MAPLVWDAALFFHMPSSVAEQALIDVHAVMHDMPSLSTPEAMLVILVGAVLPPIHEVVEPCIEHSPGNVQGCWGIVKDVWLESVEGVSMSQGVQGVILLPLGVVIQFLEIGQVLGQVSDPVMCVLKALYFGM
jgi:hypothetical protein